MANTLLITKETGGYFTFLLAKNGVAQLPIQSIRNDLLVYGTQCHFKTGSGANIIKEQFILPTDITIVASGTFTFVTVAQLWAKLIEIGYFDWLSAGSGGTGVDRFDDLLDTFKYIGNNGYAVVVNESEQKLKAIPFYNYSKFTELQDTPDDLVANKMVVVNSAGTALELKDQPETQSQSLTSVGSFHYVDLATVTTPLTVLATVEKKITNDTASTETNVLNAPYGISSMWDATNNQLDFTQTTIGDLVTVIPAIEITTTATNQTFQIYIKTGIGSATPLTKQVYNGALAVIGTIIVNPTRDFTIDNDDLRLYPAEIYILSSANATVKSGELDIKVVRKDINILNLPTSIRQTINLGTVSTTVVGAINSQLPNILIQDQNLGQIIIDGTFTGVYHQYLFVGVKGYYGTGGLTCISNDFIEIGASGGGGGSETTTTLGALIGSADDATPNDTDFIATSLTAGGILKKITWTNVKAFLKTYFDTIYAAALGSNDNYVTDAEKTVIGNTSGTNTGDQTLILPVTETGTSFSLVDGDNGKVIILTANATVTIPNGLIAGFEVSIITLAGVTLTVALGGSVVLFNNIGLTMAEKLSCTIKNRTTTNNYITAGSL